MPDIFDFDADFEDPPELTGILQFTGDMQKLKLSRDYIIVRKVGEGGMGEVNLAKTFLLGDEQHVAVKILNKRDMPSQDSLKRFQRETQLLMKAKHNNIVKFIDYWESALFAYLIMEYVDGTDLEALVQENGVYEPHEIIGLINPILQALLYMYKEHGMHHRDIKPNNIQITRGSPKKAMLIDFGNAKILRKDESTKSLTMISGQMSGTPGYIAPEVSMDNYTEQDDVFSIACTLLYCLLGRNPFEVRGDFFASFKKIQEHNLDLGKYEGTMIGHWLHINTSYKREDRMTLQQAFHSLERMQRNKNYPLKQVNRRFVEVMGSDKALMQLISRQNSEIELAASKGLSKTGSFTSLETTRPGFEAGETRDVPLEKERKRVPQRATSAKPSDGSNMLLFVAIGLLFVVVAALGLLVVLRSGEKRGDKKGVTISAKTMQGLKNADLVHWNTKLPFYRDMQAIERHVKRKEGRERIMREAASYYRFAEKHEDGLAYEQAAWRWRSVFENAPASDPLKVSAVKSLHSYYCKQRRAADAAAMSRAFAKMGGTPPLACK